MDNSVTAKLELGLERLAKAGHDPDLLGSALQSIHGALEDAFRAQLAADPHVPEAQRPDFRDLKKTQWRDLLDAMVLYRDLSQTDRDLIWRTNSVRTRVAHGGRYTGSRADLEHYAALVQRLCGYTPAAIPAAAPAKPTRPSSPATAPRARTAGGAPAIPPAVRARPKAAQPARSRIGWLAIIGATALLVIIAIAALVRNTTASPTPTASAKPSATIAASAATTATSEPPATAVPAAATVRAEGGLNIRGDHSASAKVLFAVADGTRVTLVSGPTEADGHSWWQVEVNGRQGWCAGEFLQLDSAP